jgi:uncharacterized membrane protein
MPEDPAAIDLMLTIPDENIAKHYEFMKPALRDEASLTPSLKWATADITKNERRGDFAGGGNSNSGGGGGGGGSRAASNDPGPQYADEEPF